MGPCDECLRRALLVGIAAPFAEKAVADSPGRRARELLALSDEDFAAALCPKRPQELLNEVGSGRAAALRAASKARGIVAVCRHDPSYPEQLRGNRAAPPVLFARGNVFLIDELIEEGSVTVVGARRPSSYGREVAHSLAIDLAGAGLTVVSGMAMGIDSAAHEGALDAGGKTVAVLGSGADVPHPPSKRKLYERIVERGLVISELPPGARPFRWTFPARNRIMAALARMTVVVEAAAQSGSLITATMASDLGRDVGAVPGRVGTPLAAGTNSLLADGAIVVRDAQDVLDAMLGAGAPRLERSVPELTRDAEAILDLVGRGHDTPDSIAAASGMPVGEATAGLAALELLGLLSSDSSGRYSPAAAGRAPS